MERRSIVAGRFYPGSEKTLSKEIERLLDPSIAPKKVLCVIAPHAGYSYSGRIAGKVFSSAIIPKRCIIISPNHTGAGARAAIMTSGSWSIPTGVIPIDTELASALLNESSLLKEDVTAHLEEHSIEVELPFLLAKQPDLQITPLTLSHIDIDSCVKIGKAIAEVVKRTDDDVLIVASTDMNHYENQTRTLEKDRLAIEKVKALDENGLIETCAHNQISMCGVIPTAVAITASKKLGAKKVTLIDHETSGDVSGDFNAVVGYAGFIIE